MPNDEHVYSDVSGGLLRYDTIHIDHRERDSPLSTGTAPVDNSALNAESFNILRKISRRSSTFSLTSASEETTLDELEIDTRHLKKMELISHGFSAEVYRAVWKGSDVALKELHWNSRLPEKKIEAFRKELSLMMKFRHPNLVLLMGIVTRTMPCSLILEFCSGGTLFDLLHKKPIVEISWRQRMKILIDIAKAVNYLHHLTPVVIHRDLKSLNVLLLEQVADQYDTPIAKVADFGLSTWAPFTTPGGDPDESCQSLVGTYHWMAPEVIRSKPYNERIDSFAFGIIAFEVTSRTVPYSGSLLKPLELAKAVTEGLRPDITKVDTECHPAVVNVMFRCWSAMPFDRPSFDSILDTLKSATSN
jgi:serine/threonine protein kinase